MRTPSLAAAAAAAALALAACDDTGTEISTGDDILNDDVAALAADAVQEDLEVMNALLPVMGVAYAPVAVLTLLPV